MIFVTNVEAEKTQTKVKNILRNFFNWFSNSLNLTKMLVYDTDKQMRPSSRN